MSVQPVSVQPVPTTTATRTSPAEAAAEEFDRQLRVLLDAGYPTLARMSVQAFTDLLEPLRAQAVAHAEAVPEAAWSAEGRAPFVLVVPRTVVPADQSLPLTNLGGRPGFVSEDLADIGRFGPTEHAAVPAGPAYLLLDVERGDEHLNESPDEAVPVIVGRGRSPLTYDEGIALFTQFPGVLERNRCFMTAGSRCGDRRVPALWISSGTGKDGRERRGAPKLGWCWAGNRHTWLGVASAATRVSTDA